METLQDRIFRAMRLDAAVYEEVEADESAMGQAVVVVVLSSIAAGIGTIAQGGFAAVVLGTLTALVSWYVWAYLTYWIGTRILPETETHATAGQLLRTLGFSSAPGMIRVIGIVPGLTEIVFLAAAVWMLITMIIAVRQALDYSSTLRAIGVCLIGFVVQVVAVALLFSVFGGPTPPA